MHRSTFLSLPAGRLARAAPVAAGLALVAAVVPAGSTTSGNPVTCIFLETGGAQTWTVPSGVTQATFTLYGAEGNNHSGHAASGLGAKVTATLPVTAGTVLQVNVGQAGLFGAGQPHSFGGGGVAGSDGGGGGASDVRSPASDGSYPLAVGSHAITATYGGDNNFSASSDSLTQTVNQAGTTTMVASSANPSTVGQSVTFTATVSVNSPGAGTPTGQVTFTDGSTQLGTEALNGSGTAAFTTSSLAAGDHAITATYVGDDNFSGSSGSLTQTVNKIATTTAVTSSANPSIIGAQVTYTATVTPASGTGTPTGTVTFSDGSTQITGCKAVTVSSSGTATCTVTYNAVGSHTITAAYSGDATYAASTSAALTQQVAYKVQLLYDQAKAHSSGSTVLVKLQLLNAAGANVSAAGITVTVTGLSPSPAPGTAPTGTFTFLTLDQGPGYQLNVKTTGYPAGTYTLSFTAGGDPTVHTAQFVIS